MRSIRAFIVGLSAVALLLGLPASASAADSARQTFVLVSGPGGDEDTRVIAAGPIRGRGLDVVINESESDTGFTSEDRLEFPDGDVFVTFSGPAPDFSFDSRACVGRVSGTASYVITGGTERYEGASGTGTGTFRAVFIGGRNPDGTCSEDHGDEVASSFSATLKGTATVPEHAR